MANKTLQSRVKIKTDTSTNWGVHSSFIPLSGEVCFYIDINKVKIGDGITNIATLPFLEVDSAAVANLALSLNDISSGSNTSPVYFEDGVPKPCSNTLGINTTGNAATATLAQRTNGTLTVKSGSTLIATFNGSADKVINIPEASAATLVNLIRW